MDPPYGASLSQKVSEQYLFFQVREGVCMCFRGAKKDWQDVNFPAVT